MNEEEKEFNLPGIDYITDGSLPRGEPPTSVDVDSSDFDLFEESQDDIAFLNGISSGSTSD